MSYSNLGGVAARASKLDEARELHGKALAVREALAKADPGNPDKQRELCMTLVRLAVVALTFDGERDLTRSGRIRAPLRA